MKATTADHAIADYRHRLETALSALPPDEVVDLADEVASHLAEASREDRLEAYLAEIGPPDSFAAGILAAKGLLPEVALIPEPTLVPEAPGWRRLLAGLIDAVVALAPFVVVFVLVGLVPLAPPGGNRALGKALALAFIGLSLIWTAWYWRSRTRRGGRGSAGMTLTGLRPVRAGGAVRIVKRSAVPGDRLEFRGLLGSVVLFGVAALVVVPFLTGLVVWQGRQAEQAQDLAVRAATEDVVGAVRTVALFGSALTEGADDQDMLTLVEPGALTETGALRERARKGDVANLVLMNVDKPDYESAGDLSASSATIVVTAQEQKNSADTIRFTVRKQVTHAAEDAFSVTYRIVKIE